MNLAIGVIGTSPTEEELREFFKRHLLTGLPMPSVFVEPSEVVRALDKYELVIKQILDPFERGKFHNWHTAARWMLTHTHTEFIMLSNDGLEFYHNAAKAITHGPANHANVGYLSLFTAELMAARQPKAFENPGWCEVSPNRTCVGAECLLFTRQSLTTILDTPVQGEWSVPQLVAEHPEASHSIDAILADACGILGLKTYYHSPSLCRILEQPAVQDWRQGTESKAFGWPHQPEVAATAEITEVKDDDGVEEIPTEPGN